MDFGGGAPEQSLSVTLAMMPGEWSGVDAMTSFHPFPSCTTLRPVGATWGERADIPSLN